MKRRVELGAACVAALVGFSMVSSERKSLILTLDEAVAQKKVELVCNGLGGHSGKSVELSIKNNSADILQLRLPEGTLFEADNASEQNLLVPEPEVLVLIKGQKKKFNVSGYCTELSDMSPSKGSGFKLKKTGNENMKKLVAYFKQHPGLPEDDVQEAIWCISDGSDVSNICNDTTQQVKDLRKFVCELTKQPDVWYNTPIERVVTPERVISNVPTVVFGMITLEADKAMKIKSEIRDASGKMISANPETMSFPQGKFHFEFKVTVKGWEKGKYTVVYYSEEKTIISQEFEI